MFVLSSPSGAGKTTLAHNLLKKEESLFMSVSVTTRPRRAAETEGKDYYFLSEADFIKMRDEQKLLESAQVFGHYYGTPKRAVDEMLEKGHDVLFDIDWQGTQHLVQMRAEDVVSVFILPPSAEALRLRITQRGQDNSLTLAGRMKEAPGEISHYAEYDYIIVNRDLDKSLHDLQAILRAERLKRQRLEGLADLVDGLRRQLANDL